MFSWIPSLSTLKYYALAVLGFLVVLFWALLQSEKKQRAQEKLKGIKQARKTEQKANKALMEGLQNEQNSKNNIDIVNRTDFE